MSDRGEYRSIHTVLVDGPDYQALTPHERLMVFVVKMSLGPSGIDVVPSMIGTLCERTGLDAHVASAVLDSLEQSGWIRRERNILWLVEGLRHEPSLAPSNPKHRKGVLHHVRGLPRIGIVNEYAEAYPEWFDEAAKQSIGYAPSNNNGGMAIDSLSKQEVGSRNEEEGKGNKPSAADAPVSEKPLRKRAPKSTEARYQHFAKADCDRLYQAWQQLGTPDYGRFRRAFAPLFPEVPRYAVDDLEAGIAEAIEDAVREKETGRPFAFNSLTPERFVQRVDFWVAEAKAPLEVDGIPTEKFHRIMGAA